MLLNSYEEAAADWLRRVDGLAPLVEKHRDAIEQERQMPNALVLAMRDADLFRMWMPKEYGGCEVDLVTSRLVIEAAGRLDGSVGWYVSILNESAAQAAYLGHEGASEVFGDRDVIVAGSAATAGQAERVEGGYLVSGTWPLASGSPHAQWLWGAAPVSQGDAAPEPYLFLMRAPQCTVLDTWHSTGLRGSGSHHIQAESVFVPRHRALPLSARPRFPRSIYPSDYIRMLSPNHAAVGLGVAFGALDAFKQLARTKPGARGVPPLGEQQTVHALVGRSEMRLQAARLALHDASAETQRQLHDEGDVSERRFLMNRLVGAHVAAEATDVVSQLYTAAGSTAVYQSHRLDRALRDVHTVNQHVSTSPANYAMGGKQLLAMS